ncbi:MAG TPA: hypothetical protein VKA61_08555 [Sphingomicrobium sp.]|nr:hypothetical protein [Sphingomicrobium sp.]
MPHVAALESVDVGKAFERVAELVDAVCEAGFRERIDLERADRTVGQPDLLLVEISEDRCAGVGFEPSDLGRDDLLRQDDRQQPVLQAVRQEDVAEARGDDDMESVVVERPNRVLALFSSFSCGTARTTTSGCMPIL